MMIPIPHWRPTDRTFIHSFLRLRWCLYQTLCRVFFMYLSCYRRSFFSSHVSICIMDFLRGYNRLQLVSLLLPLLFVVVFCCDNQTVFVFSRYLSLDSFPFSRWLAGHLVNQVSSRNSRKWVVEEEKHHSTEPRGSLVIIVKSWTVHIMKAHGHHRSSSNKRSLSVWWMWSKVE